LRARPPKAAESSTVDPFRWPKTGDSTSKRFVAFVHGFGRRRVHAGVVRLCGR
jgi:hypothetical protein